MYVDYILDLFVVPKIPTKDLRQTSSSINIEFLQRHNIFFFFYIDGMDRGKRRGH